MNPKPLLACDPTPHPYGAIVGRSMTCRRALGVLYFRRRVTLMSLWEARGIGLLQGPGRRKAHR